MGLEFSSSQQQISASFTAYRNDIDIFTEDEYKDKVFYKKLFSRLMEGTGIRINDVYPLGSSEDVIAACAVDTNTNRKKLYIVDGDINLLYNPKPPIPNLYVLDAYCIENFVVDEEAVSNTLCHFIGEREIDEIKRMFDYNQFISDHKSKLVELFYHFAMQDKYCKAFTLYPVERYYDKDSFQPLKVDVSIQSIKREILATGLISESGLEAELESLRTSFPNTPETFMKIVSGKDYFIEMVHRRASNNLGYKLGHKKEAWKFNFASYCSLERLYPLRDTIVSIVRSV